MTAKLSVGVPESRPDVHTPSVSSKTTSFEAPALAVAGNAIKVAAIIMMGQMRLTLSSCLNPWFARRFDPSSRFAAPPATFFPVSAEKLARITRSGITVWTNVPQPSRAARCRARVVAGMLLRAACEVRLGDSLQIRAVQLPGGCEWHFVEHDDLLGRLVADPRARELDQLLPDRRLGPVLEGDVGAHVLTVDKIVDPDHARARDARVLE